MLTDDLAAAALDALPSFVAVVAADGTVVRLNEAWRRSAATGLTVVPVRPGGSWLAACEAAAERVAAIGSLASMTRQMLDHRRDRGRIEILQVTPKGRRWLDVRLRPMGAAGGLVVVVDDVTERREREEALRHRATHDPVTGLANRLTIRDLISEALAHREAGGDPAQSRPGPAGEPASHQAAVIFLDVDAFHRVNQSFGYATGDAALRAVGVRLRAALRPEDRLARWGGDEFVVLARDITGSGAVALAERLTASLGEPLTVEGHRVRISASIGLAFSGSLPDATGAAKAAPGTRNPGAARPGGPASAHTAEADLLVRLAGEEVVRARAHRQRRRPRG